MVKVEDGQVVLKKGDGNEITVALERLSEADQAYVNKHRKGPGDVRSTGKAKAEVSDGPKVEASAKAKADSSPKPAPKTGKLSLSFPSYSPLAASSTVIARMLMPQAAGAALAKLRADKGQVYDHYYVLAEESWDVYVPEDYDGGTLHGVLVFLSPGDGGGLTGSWLPLMKSHHLIYVVPKKAGNDKDVLLKRLPMALDAVHNLHQQYRIDPDRVYLSGLSGGGRAASWGIMAFPEVFTGGIFFCGVNFYATSQPKKGHEQIPPQKTHAMAREHARLVFVTGDKDFNRRDTKECAALYSQDGFRHTTVLDVPGMGHALPESEWIEKGLVALDQPLLDSAKSAFDQARKMENRKQLGDAMFAYGAAAAHGREQAFVAGAKTKYQELSEQYQGELGDLEQLVNDGDRTAVSKLRTFRSRWGKAAQADEERLSKSLHKRGGKSSHAKE